LAVVVFHPNSCEELAQRVVGQHMWSLEWLFESLVGGTTFSDDAY
jgi:hypothetical protein